MRGVNSFIKSQSTYIQPVIDAQVLDELNRHSGRCNKKGPDSGPPCLQPLVATELQSHVHYLTLTVESFAHRHLNLDTPHLGTSVDHHDQQCNPSKNNARGLFFVWS